MSLIIKNKKYIPELSYKLMNKYMNNKIQILS